MLHLQLELHQGSSPSSTKLFQAPPSSTQNTMVSQVLYLSVSNRSTKTNLKYESHYNFKTKHFLFKIDPKPHPSDVFLKTNFQAYQIFVRVNCN